MFTCGTRRPSGPILTSGRIWRLCYEHDYAGFLAVLKRNSKKLQVDPARREPAQALRAEFEGSMRKLAPLRERIRQTDELIDATVYRLYGLTEEEIGIVRGETR